MFLKITFLNPLTIFNEILGQAKIFPKISFSDKYQSIFELCSRFINFSMIRTAKTVLKLAFEQLKKYSLH